MIQSQDKNRIPEIPEEMLEHIHQLDEAIPLTLQNNYFRQSTLIRKKMFKVTPDYITEAKQILENSESIDTAILMDYLSHLAIGGNIEALRLIESFVPEQPGVLRQWALMAQLEARLGVLSELIDEKQIAISSGLGGHNGLMRMEALIYHQALEPFKEYEKKLIMDEFGLIVEQQKGEIEKINFGENYAVLFFLLPFKNDIKAVFEKLAYQCNQYGNFLSPKFMVTNTEHISKTEINKMLAAYRKENIDNNIKTT